MRLECVLTELRTACNVKFGIISVELAASDEQDKIKILT
jgi:hypothetical protein